MMTKQPALLLVSLILLTRPGLWAQQSGDALEKGELALQELRFEDAAALLTPELIEAKPEGGKTAYLRALALLMAGKHADASAAGEAVSVDSKWAHKAAFLKAEALAELRKHDEVEAIFSDQAKRVFDTGRKEAIGKLLEDFADEILAKLDSGETAEGGAGAAIGRAERLYTAALNLPLGPEMRERLHFKIVQVRERLGIGSDLLRRARTYLELFDPRWEGELGSNAGKRSRITREKLGGGDVAFSTANLNEVRLLMLRSELAAQNREEVRIYAERFIIEQGQEEGAQALAGELAWVVCRSFGPREGLAEPANAIRAQRGEQRQQQAGYLSVLKGVPDAELYLEVLEKFLAEHPDHPRAVDALHAQAAQLERRSEWKEAADVYRKLLALPDPARGEGNEERGEVLRNAKQAAQFQLGELHFRQKEFEEAIGQWRIYVNKFPNGPLWERAQGRMVDAEFQRAIEAVRGGDDDGARKLFEEFLVRYPLDSRARIILFVLGQMEYAAAAQLEKDGAAAEEQSAAWGKTVESWARLTGKYPDSEEASLAAYRSALVVSEKQGKPEEGLDRLKKIGRGKWAEPAKARVNLMEAKSLAAVGERIWRTGEEAKVKVRVRNIEKLSVSQFPLGLEEFFRRKHFLTPTTVESLDIDLIEPERTWEVEVADFKKGASLEQEIAVPIAEGKPGVSIVRVEGDGWESSALVVRSDLEIILNSAQHEALIYVQGKGGEPEVGATVLVSNGSKIVGEGKTAPDGTFSLKGKPVRETSDLCVYVRAVDGSEAIGKINLRGMTSSMQDMSIFGSGKDPGPTRRALIGTDKDYYAPGDRMRWSGVVRDVEDGKYVAPGGRDYRLFILNSRGRSLRDDEIVLADDGSFSGEFDLSPEIPTGRYRLRIAREEGGEAHEVAFVVERAQTRSRSVTVEVNDDAPVRGSEINGVVRVRGWFRDLLEGERVTVRLPDGRTLEGVTDAEGSYAFKMGTAMLSSGRQHLISAYAQKFSLSGQKSVLVRSVGASVDFEDLPSQAFVGEELQFGFRFSGGGQKAGEAGLKLRVARVEDSKTHPVLEAVPWLERPVLPLKKVDMLERDVAVGEEAGDVLNEKVTFEEAGSYEVTVSGKDRKGHEFSRWFRIRVLDGKGRQKLFASAREDIAVVGSEAEIEVHSVDGASRALMVVASDVIESHQFIELKPGKQTLRVKVSETFWPNFHVRIAYLDADGLHSRSVDLDVRRGVQLQIDIAEGAEFSPGERVKATVTAKDSKGEPLATGLLLRLSDVQKLPKNISPWRRPVTDRSPAEYFLRGARVIPAFRSSATSGFRFLGRSRKVTENEDGSRTVGFAQNDIQRFLRIQLTEAGSNPGNMAILDRNEAFVSGNGFLSEADYRSWRNTHYSSGMRIQNYAAQGGTRNNEPWEGGELEWWSGGRPVVWMPDIRSGDDGKVEVEFVLPEEEGEWRLTVNGAAGGDAFGNVGRNLVTKRSLGLRLLKPEALRVGDSWQPTLIVDGRRAKREVKLSLMLGDNGAEANAKEEISVPVDGIRRVTFAPIAIENSMGPNLNWSVKTEGGDLVRGDTPVIGAGLFDIAGTSGGVVSGDGEPNLAKPEKSEAETATNAERSALFFAGLVLGGDEAGALGEMGWRSRVESAALGQELLAAVSALDLFEGDDGDKAARESERYGQLRERVRSLVGILQVLQRDGGWRWNEINAYRDTVTTAVSLRGLVEARRLGFEVEEEVMKRATRYLLDALAIIPRTESEKAAMILHALSLQGEADFSVANRLYRDRDEIEDMALAYLSAALIRMGREEMAKDCLKLLAGRVQRENSGAKWNGSAVVSRLSPPEDTTAMALWALSRVDGDAKLRDEVAAWLLNRQGAAPAATGRAHGIVAAALCEHFKTQADVKLKAVTWFGMAELAKKEGNGGIADLRIVSKRLFHEGIYDEGALVASSTSPVSKAVYGQRVRVEVEIEDEREVKGYLVWDEAIPGGCRLIPGTLRGNYAKVEKTPAGLRLYYRPSEVMGLNYDLVAVCPGKFTVPATRIRDAYNAAKFEFGGAGNLEILPPDVESPDTYETNITEHFALAQRRFARGDYAQAEKELREFIAKIGAAEQGETGRAKANRERELARMMLWIETAKEKPTEKEVVRWFEVINERYPETVIPFDKVLTVAWAYQEIGESERSWLVDRAVIGGSFLEDASVSAVLEDHGDFFGSVALQQRLWEDYPDIEDVVSARFALSQDLVQKAERPDAVRVREASQKPSREELLDRGKELLDEYLTLYAGRDGMEGAAFSLANVLFLLKDYPGMVRRCEVTLAAKPGGEMADTFHYLAALGHFWQIRFAEALEAAAKVVESQSKDRNYARYVTAQIYHAMDEPEKAIVWYRKVEDIFDDAKVSLASLEEKSVLMPEVTAVRPGEVAEVKLRYRNIRSAALQIYKVDLMKLYLRKKNLGNISEVDLAGITSQGELAVELGEGKDYAWREKGIPLGLKDEGAYLVICRGDGLFSSGLVLISPLEMKVREVVYGGFVRLSVRDTVKDEFVPDAEVKAVGSGGGSFQSGRTDPRGTLQLSGLKGKATVVVRQGPGRYAIFRGGQDLRGGGKPGTDGSGALIPALQEKSPDKSDYLKNIQTDNFYLQEKSNKAWKAKRIKGGKGIQAQEALKK